jgi:hypothetical protein
LADRVHQNPNLVYSVGTQVVTLRNVTAEGGKVLHSRGSVGVVVRSPGDLSNSYRVRFLDGVEEPLARFLSASSVLALMDSITTSPTAATTMNDLLVRVRLKK